MSQEFSRDWTQVEPLAYVSTDGQDIVVPDRCGPSITQDLVNDATLAFDQANITYVSTTYSISTLIVDYYYRDIANAEGFQLSLQGSATNVGPLNALIEFVDPVTYVFIQFVFAGAHVGQGNVARP